LLIPEAKIEEIRERTDLVALVSRHGVELKKSGRNLKGCCPFHQEKTPSFYVYPDTRRYKCFGCQAGGDAFSFVQRLMGKTFVDTIRDLAKEAGVDIEGAVDPAQKEKAQIKDATDAAQEHFKKNLWDDEVGKVARAYLKERGVSEELARAFGLGWAPEGWTHLADKLRELGLLAFGEKAGLVAPRPRGDGDYDMFRGRLMIPIRSPEGRTIAFGGRLLIGDDGPKYLNSKESRLYNKSETLYALDAARDDIRKKKSAVLCEGYFDAIGMHQAGVKNAVALCSTALTPGHLAQLARCEAKELVLLLDGDDAGRKGAERLAGPILAAGASAKVALLPQGDDPDTYARREGDKAVAELIAKAQPLTTWLFSIALPDGPEASFEAKMSALDRLKPIAAALPIGLVRSAFFSAAAKAFGLPAAELEVALRGKAPPPVRAVPKQAPAFSATPGGQVASRPPSAKGPPLDPLEVHYTAYVLRDRRLIQKDTHRIFDELKGLPLRGIVAALSAGQAGEDVLYDAAEDVQAALRTVEQPSDDESLERAFLTACRMLKLKFIREQLERIAKETAQLPGGTSDLTDEVRQLSEERKRLLALKLEVERQKT
jgi:DNA primase